MSEEEIIEQIKNDMNVGEFYGITEDAIKGLLDLYNKQKEEIEIHKETENDYEHEIKRYEEQIEELKKPKFIINAETGEVTKIHNDFVSKAKIRDRIKNAEILIHNYLGNTEISSLVYKEIIKILEAQINVLEDLLGD